ncbi:MAG TPA: SOS response-associated peptidase [Hyphomicrobiaceae bacterium]|jgi:putative SOS response-associated peptidase YedK|nr:SOS response-associated peptidase [Hyphomicrobiaceae bacterium]
MCSRYNLLSPLEAVRAYFRVSNGEPYPPRYNIAPTQPVLIVRLDETRRRELALVRWGLIPGWAKDPARLSLMINARAEGATEKASFRGAMRHRRCLVPANGFYEWTGRAGARQPHLIQRPDSELIAFAGLWESWLGADGSEIDTMAILTVPANTTLTPLHDRMPAILLPEHFDAWLDTRGLNAEMAAEMLRPAPDALLEHITVDPRLNNARNEGPELIKPYSDRLL